MEHDIRPITDEELPALFRVLSTAFGSAVEDEQLEDERSIFELDRSLGVFDGGDVVGSAGAYSFDLTVPGGATIPVAGVTWVGVLPTHRRRGVLTAMMRRQLDDIAERGETVAVLTASEGRIYGRFGYGTASFATTFEIQTAGCELRPSAAGSADGSAGGRVRLLTPEDAAKVIPGVYDRARVRRPGPISRRREWWDMWLKDRERWREGASTRFYVVHESAAGEADAYLAYRVKEDWNHGVPRHRLVVVDGAACDDGAEAALWRYCLDVDLVGVIEARWRPVDDPLRWRLADPRRLRPTETGDGLWVRLIDVPAALAARRYGVEDRLVLELTDPFRPDNEGRYVVEGGPDGATAARTDAEPDLSLDVADLGALHLGGVVPSELAAAGRIVERTPGALRRADPFFLAHPAPWCNTPF